MKKLRLLSAVLLFSFVTACGGPSSNAVITSITPNTGSTSGGTPIVIAGDLFNQGSTVTIGSNAATDVVVVDRYTINAVTPAGALGAADVTVTSPTGLAGTLAGGFTYGTPTLTINVVDKNGDPIADAYVMIGQDATGLNGPTDAAGAISFTSEGIDLPQTITAAKNGYRNVTVFGSTAPVVTITLSLYDPPAGVIQASIDNATWGALADDPPNNVFRFALIGFPSPSMGETVNQTACTDCMVQTQMNGLTLFVPFFAANAKIASYVDRTRAFALAGLVDFNTFTFTVYKFGMVPFSIDATNTQADPKAVTIPLIYDFSAGASVTIGLAGITPAPTEALFEFFNMNTPQFGLVQLGFGFPGFVLNGTQLSAVSCQFNGLMASAIASNPDLTGAAYLNGAALGDGDSLRLSFSSSNIIDTVQSVDVTALLDQPVWLIPSQDETIDDMHSVTYSWAPHIGNNFNLIEITLPYFNGTEQGGRTVWEVLTPQEMSAFELPTLPAGTSQDLEACLYYDLRLTAVNASEFSYDDGNFGFMESRIFDLLPVLASTSAVQVFTSGTGCAPLVIGLSPTSGNAGGGDVVTITGKYFGAVQGASTVTFGANPAAVTSWSDTSIGVTTPAGVGGTAVKVNVNAGGEASNDAYFKYN